MSKDDENEGGGSLVQFPRVFLPGSFDAAGREHGPDAGEVPADTGGRVPGAWPNLPRVADMVPPLALSMPGIPKPDAVHDSHADEEGAFQPPAPEDYANPTAKETLAVALAVVTAMGVAAAQGMWHRARRRAALADEARAAADRSLAKAAGAKEAARAKRGTKQASPTGSGGGGKTGARKRHGGHGTGPGRGGSPKGPKARRDGRTPRRKDDDRPRRRKDRPGWRKRRDDEAAGRKRKRPDTNPPKAPKTKPPKNTKTPKVPEGSAEKRRWKRSKRKDGKGWTFRPSKNRPKSKPAKPRDKMTWKAPTRKPGPGQAKAITGRRRWRGRGAKYSKRQRFGLPRFGKRTWRATKRWLKRNRLQRRAAAAGIGTSWGWMAWTAFKRRAGRWRATGRSWARRSRSGAYSSSGTQTPPPGPEGMRPPPGADRTVRVTAERVDNPGQRERRPDYERERAALLAGGDGASGGRSAPEPPAPPHPAPTPTRRARPVSSVPDVPNYQYRDAELTIRDVIEADMDMAEEITAGVDEARAVADGAEQLMTRLEAIRAKVIELKVPGLLAGWLVRLMDKTLMVKASAVGIAAELPAAAEAISVAGANAAARHLPLADVTRDMGHVRPAEREYHDE
ncbi:hypothetical protein [Nonomuraea rubra]|uniref:hypothetical protein n=1 Tax=Nonomuraea rubra TaxID=46180 RepID=UPI0033E47885